ncbi:unnamed protein product [Acanthoscelides obtectus]|uniref:PiggyBac transposable element-derived protein domain-containing protein n=1 Tax=Acanthoscelides obtectus TaxID=200917 RepID=A0A9P0MK21_ACAOB|nr:unnamed protein product [Acanthoscelides obtectus]CAK1654907.1 hypothetical protein AOBTE_LOCUS18915 [Acanthoscelides obtectus]
MRSFHILKSEYPEDAADDIEVPWAKEGIPHPNFPFTSDPGIKVPDISSDNILEIFELFLNQHLTNLVVEETNRYANQFIIKNHENIRPPQTKIYIYIYIFLVITERKFALIYHV